MSLKYKFLILFIFVAVVPLILAAFLIFKQSESIIILNSVNNLNAVADLEEKRINEALDRYLSEISLISSRTQFRILLKDYLDDKDENLSGLSRVKKILSDAKDSIDSIGIISVIDLDGNLIVSTDENIESDYRLNTEFLELAKKSNSLSEIFKDSNNILKVRLVGPVVLDNEKIAILDVIADSDQILNITEDRSGLGETGEVLLAKKNDADDALFLTPLRFDAGAALERAVSKEALNIPVTRSVAGEETLLTHENVTDYRGKPVIAATRYIDALDWGVVVKRDKSEILKPIQNLTYIFLIITFLAIILASSSAFFFIRRTMDPLKYLRLFAQNIQSGNFSMRTEVTSKDELGFLADTMNEMASKIQNFYTSLEEQIEERTKELKEQTLKFENMFDKSVIGAALVSPKGEWLDVNNSLIEITGYSRGELMKLKFQDITYKKDLEKDLEKLDQVLDGKIDTYNLEKRCVHKKGHVIWVLFGVSCVREKNGSVKYLISQMLDITKQKEVDQAKTEFVSLASHQLRTPLSSVKWYTEMLLAGDAGKITKIQKEYLGEIFVGNERMIDLVNALLNVSRIDLGTFIIEASNVDITKILKEEIKVLQHQLDIKKIKTDIKIDKIKEVDADEKILRILFQNLISNAAKYTPERGKISISLLDHDSKKLKFIIKDTGFGIPKKDQKQIFTKLFRADNVKQKDTTGTGLGLYLVKSILDTIGGKISFKSEVDQGTTFEILIPKKMRSKRGEKRLS